jgi:hypothetical protein
MTSKMIALRVLDGIFIGFAAILLLVLAGVPLEGLLAVINMSGREFQPFALFVLFSTLGLIHAIATSDSAP